VRKTARNIVVPALIVIGACCSGTVLGEDVPAPAAAVTPAAGKIALDLKNIDLIELLRILSIKTGKTIAPSKDINGRINVFLNNVTFEDALDIILVSNGLACEKKNDIIYIMTNAEYKARTGRDYREPRKMITIKLTYSKPSNIFNVVSQLKSEMGKLVVDEASGTLIILDVPEKLLVMQKAVKKLDRPLETKVYDLNYAKASDAKAQLGAAITPGTGEVIIDERSGKAIVSDLPQKMDKIDRLVKEIDEETRQVFLECEIVQITLSDTFQRGINWEKVFGDGVDGLDFTGSFPVSSTLSAYQKISVGTLARDKYNAVINLLNTYGSTRILSQPLISVVNHEESNVMVGVRDAYVTQTLSQGGTSTVTSEQVEFVDVGVKLKVSPTIGADGFITMKIKPEVSSVRETVTTSLGSRIPIVQTSQTETVVKVKNGTMIMMGGLLERSHVDTVKGIPGLSRMPFIGPFFGNRDQTKKLTELVIFITPHLIRGDSENRVPELDRYMSGPNAPATMRKHFIADFLSPSEEKPEGTDGASLKPQEGITTSGTVNSSGNTTLPEIEPAPDAAAGQEQDAAAELDAVEAGPGLDAAEADPGPDAAGQEQDMGMIDPAGTAAAGQEQDALPAEEGQEVEDFEGTLG